MTSVTGDLAALKVGDRAVVQGWTAGRDSAIVTKVARVYITVETSNFSTTGEYRIDNGQMRGRGQSSPHLWTAEAINALDRLNKAHSTLRRLGVALLRTDAPDYPVEVLEAMIAVIPDPS